MSYDELCLAIGESLPALFECTPAAREGVRVRTPLMYPDGGMVDVFVLEQSGRYSITDFGEDSGLAADAIREHSTITQAESHGRGHLPDLGGEVTPRPTHATVGCG